MQLIHSTKGRLLQLNLLLNVQRMCSAFCNFTYFWKDKQLYSSMTSIQEKALIINIDLKEFQVANTPKSGCLDPHPYLECHHTP